MGKKKLKKKSKGNIKQKSYDVKRTYKDSIFRSLFDDRETLQELYSALSGKPISKNEEIKIVTLKNPIFNEVQNDLAFTIGTLFIVMIEHQSTDCPNIPVRMLNYIADEYKNLVDDELVYATKPIKILTPQLYVLYNGTANREAEWIYKLSDLFEVKSSNPAVEVEVKVINKNYENGSDILKKCKVLEGYSVLISKVNKYINEYKEENNGPIEDKIKLYREALDEAMKKAII